MKCPKCGYLGFEDLDRCRHCGYDFSLTTTTQPHELLLQDVDRVVSPLEDAALVDAAGGRGVAARVQSQSRVERPTGSATTSERELPLFGGADDAPLIRQTSTPRPPLAVRRATPETPKLRSSLAKRTPLLDLRPSGAAVLPVATDAAGHAPTGSAPVQLTAQPAGIGARLGAMAVDGLVLLAIDAVVVYLTMQVCGVALADARLLPRGPLLTFLVAQNLSYFVVFTAGGQTLGKMATGIRVVSASDHLPPDFGHSTLRTLVWAVLAVPAGLGFVTALPGRERRGLHDLCAGTKVVRASA